MAELLAFTSGLVPSGEVGEAGRTEAGTVAGAQVSVEAFLYLWVIGPAWVGGWGLPAQEPARLTLSGSPPPPEASGKPAMASEGKTPSGPPTPCNSVTVPCAWSSAWGRWREERDPGGWGLCALHSRAHRNVEVVA